MWLTSGRSASALVASELSELFVASSPRHASEGLGSESRAAGVTAASALALARAPALGGCSADGSDAPPGAAPVAATLAATLLSVLEVSHAIGTSRALGSPPDGN